MKKYLGFLFGVTLSSAAFGQASVADEFGCFLSPSDSGLAVGLFSTEKTHSVITPSGNTSLVCHFKIPSGFELSRAIVNSGFGCGTFLGFTTDSRSVVNPGGNATLTCKI